jgi:hypothetical protein
LLEQQTEKVDSSRNYCDPNQVEAQLRVSPDGTKFYAVWNEGSVDGSDCRFSRIMSSAFMRNVGKTETVEP